MAVDLEEVKMIDSSGLGVLIAAHNSLQKLGARLELLNVSDDIRKLLQNMRLDKHFTIQ
jgi:anti-anti-sigma factor